ncbi:MAG: PKD domain-containing protein [Candidatus Pacebacteria bacterium]|nr:PKD domain-containing protein [Candidatus Paceibacterota bacterium]
MNKIKLSKKVFILILTLAGLGLFIFFLLFPATSGVPKEIKKQEEAMAKIQGPVSSVYRYDLEKREYVADLGESWQNSNFYRYIYDLAPAGSALGRCYYFLYDNVEKEMSGGGQRKCNANLEITVGENMNCRSQGENACTLYVYALDDKENRGEISSLTYNVDWAKPEVGKVSREGNKYLAEISDNLKVSYCWFYLNDENKGQMKIENNSASFEYALPEENYSVFVKCADHYDAEKGKYLNLTVGEIAKFVLAQNRPPEISFCKVSPNQGSVSTEFKFEIEAIDPDGDSLSYQWDFNDGEKSADQNPIHRYQKPNTFEPRVVVSDALGEKNSCFTAWVVVEE